MPTEPMLNRTTLRRRTVQTGTALVLAAALAACASSPAPDATAPATYPVSPPPVQGAPAVAPASTIEAPQAAVQETPTVEPQAEEPARPGANIAVLLELHERLRALPPAELAAHITAQGDPGNVPQRLMELGLALSNTHQPPDTARALGLMQRVVSHPSPDSVPLKPLARLMAARLLDQRRLEEAIDRHSQQLRESQRRIDLLNERLEAMRAIERSLIPRPPTSGSGLRP